MEIHDIQQGTPEWDAFRRSHFGASEAAAMLGLSKKVKRTELLRMKHTGIAKEFSDWVQENILDHGHEVEAMARPIMERVIGAKLYPVTASDGDLSASCDGLTADDSTAFEHKQWNAELVESVRNGVVPEDHMPQCQQILLVTGAQRVFFTVSDGTEQNMVYAVVEPDQEWFDRIRAGWAQFKKDLADYQHVEIAEKPKGEAILDLPALAVQATGTVIYSNLPEVKAAAQAFIDSINTNLVTDQDFAVAEATVKFCKATEEKLDAAKAAILAQTSSIDEVIRTVDHIQAQLRDKRLIVDKLVKSEKEARKTAMVMSATTKYNDHISDLHAEISGVQIIPLMPRQDFGGAIKGLKSLSSMHDALETALANAKIAADSVAKDVRAKLAWCKENAEGHSALFPDLQQIIAKPMEDFSLTITSRIEKAKADEAARLEAERQRIEAEAKAKAEREAAAKMAEEESRIRAEERAKAQAEATARAQSEAAAKPATTPVDVLHDAAHAADHAAVAVNQFASAIRPTRMQMIDVIAQHYGVSVLAADEWLRAEFAEVAA